LTIRSFFIQLASTALENDSSKLEGLARIHLTTFSYAALMPFHQRKSKRDMIVGPLGSEILRYCSRMKMFDVIERERGSAIQGQNQKLDLHCPMIFRSSRRIKLTTHTMH
jgi:hypothetical protein